MSLTTALRTAHNSLLNTARQTIVTSRNVSEATNENYARREAVIASASSGARIVSVQRSSNSDLFWHSLQAKSDSSAQTMLGDAATRLKRLVNGVDDSTAPTTLISSFENALQLYSSDPSNTLAASSAVASAKELAIGLNNGSAAIQEYRASLDQDISDSVEKLNVLLSDFKDVNDEIVSGTRTGADINDALDQRQKLLKDISEFVSINAVDRGDNDMAIYTGQGVTLFETVARTVTFEPINGYSAGMTGNSIRVDGVPIVQGSGANTNASGTLAAMMQVRDGVAVQMQAQLDEVARGLVETFKEEDPLALGADAAGLFTWSGDPAVPASGTLSSGIAATLRIKADFDPDVGGNPEYLRDGFTYSYNGTGGSAFSERLIGYVEGMNSPVATDITAGITGTYSLSGYAETSLGWLESLRSTAQSAADSKSALYERLNSDHIAETGVNIDEEMSLLIELEQSYEASARIISVVDEMLSTLLSSVR